MQEKFKSFLSNDQMFYGSLVIIVSICSFLLGQLSITPTEASQNNEVKMVEPIVLPAPNAVSDDPSPETIDKQTASKTTVVGSKNGTKYHLLTCPSAKRIKPENLVTFSDIREAEAAGYSRAGNCPEL